MKSDDERLRIERADALGPLSDLEPLARDIFGEGQRPAGWFERKLERECVDPKRSLVLVDAKLNTPQARGYVLVGRPPSMGNALRTAGIGLIAELRRQGWGKALLRRLGKEALSGGIAGVWTSCQPPQKGFYESLGYRERNRRVTLLAFARGPAFDPCQGPVSRVSAPVAHERLGGWLREAWEQTPAHEQGFLRWPCEGGLASAHLTREGNAYLVHQIEAPASALRTHRCIDLVDRLLQRLPAPAPVLLYGCDLRHPATSLLQTRGLRNIQSFADMYCSSLDLALG